jgi:hypothetical protein
MSIVYIKTIKTMRTLTTTTMLAIFAIVTAVALVTAAGFTHSVLAVKSSIKNDSSSGLKKFFDCVTKAAKNGKPSRLDVDYCYDATYSSSGVSSSASAGTNGASAAASAG